MGDRKNTKSWPKGAFTVTRTTTSTVLLLTLAGLLSLATPATAQFRIGSTGISFGSSKSGSPQFHVGRPGRSHHHVSPPITDRRYRGPVQQHPHPKPSCPAPTPRPVPVEPTPVPPTPPTDAEVALQLTYEAQAAFRHHDYRTAATKMDRVVQLSPKSAAAYQFRALVHFAAADYDKAAADIYETLLRGPLWDWNTVYPLYENEHVYGNQYRALARAAKEDSQSMSKHFVLAYHHLVLGHLQHGERELQKVLAIVPNEPVMTQLLSNVQQLQNATNVAQR